MAENGKILAVGAAYVEAKIQSSNLHLPTRRRELTTFLDSHPEARLSAGGSIPNVLSSFINMSDIPTVKLFSCVGNDQRGDYYTQEMQQIFGRPKRSKDKPTGIFVGIYDNGLREGLDSHGASYDFTLSSREIKRAEGKVFITDISTCKDYKGFNAVKKLLTKVHGDNNLFVLSLGGAIPSSSTREQIDNIFNSFGHHPDIIFGNEAEFLYTVDGSSMQDTMPRAFPHSKLIVITQAEKGAVVKYKKEVVSIPVSPIEYVIDETGAGDSYMGTMLALLLRENPGSWSLDKIIYAANVAGYAASLVIQSMQSKVTPEIATQVKEYAERY